MILKLLRKCFIKLYSEVIDVIHEIILLYNITNFIYFCIYVIMIVMSTILSILSMTFFCHIVRSNFSVKT